MTQIPTTQRLARRWRLLAWAAPLLVALLLPTDSRAAGRFPFPRNRDYAHGIRTRNSSSSGQEIQAAYETWLSSTYRERGDRACIAGSGYAGTVFQSSELAYGMLILVYMDNAANDTRTRFDRLLASYDRNLDSNGLMNWRILWKQDSTQSTDSVTGRFAATDGDLDAALALLLAFRQWSDSSYLVRAKELIGHIWKAEVDSAGNLKPGDDWNPYKNPSYLNFVALHLFAKVDGHDWASVLKNSWAMLAANTSSKNSTARLPSDWCAPDGTPVAGKSGIRFHADAMRVPFRVGLAWSWFGDSAAAPIDSGIAAFALSSKYSIAGKPDSITYAYHLDGSKAAWTPYSSFMLGAFTSAGMVDASFRDWVDTGYSRMRAWANRYGDSYLGSLRLMELLYMSGNFNNFWDESFDPPTGLAERPAPSLLQVSTEGGNTVVHIMDGPLSFVSVLTAQGRRLPVPVSVRSASTRVLETRDLPSGVYLVQWATPGRTGCERLLVGARR